MSLSCWSTIKTLLRSNLRGREFTQLRMDMASGMAKEDLKGQTQANTGGRHCSQPEFMAAFLAAAFKNRQ